MDPYKLLSIRIAQQCQRYEDMAKHFRQMHFTQQLTQEERGFFSTAYKNVLSARRTAWRAVSAYELRLQQGGANQVEGTVAWYREKVQKEIRVLCSEVLEILQRLVKVSNVQSKIFYSRMKGDIYRYLAQITKDIEFKRNQQSAVKAYEQAIMLVGSISLPNTNQLRLGAFLNLAVFYYEIGNNLPKAVEVCEKAFNEASDKLNDISDDQFKDTTTIMQLMYDNLTQWKAELAAPNK